MIRLQRLLVCASSPSAERPTHIHACCLHYRATRTPDQRSQRAPLWGASDSKQTFVASPLKLCQLALHLFIKQLFVFSGVTKEDVRQLGPHVVVLEVTDLWEPCAGRQKGKESLFVVPKPGELVNIKKTDKQSAGDTDVLNTSCLIIPFSSLSWKNLFHRLWTGEGDRRQANP